MAKPQQVDVSFLDTLIEDPKVKRIVTITLLKLLKGVTVASRPPIIKMISALSVFSGVMKETNNRVSTFKTFIDPTKPVSLLDHFVEMKLVDKDEKKFDHIGLIAKLSRSARVVISATAGHGKSVLMRYLALSLYENPIGKVPLFLELRELNRVSTPNIINYIFEIYRKDTKLSQDVFSQALSSGAFVVLLDGFDEINYDLRDQVEQQILKLCEDYPKCTVVVSGRPDDKFLSWKKFSVYQIVPMELTQVINLINLLEFDNGTKKRFVKKLKDGLYKSHPTFLSTPLLATLMLLTFAENANIPDKMHIFYLRAFETLFYKHDTYKDQYDRKRRSQLRIDQFSKIFSVFCLNTYVQEKFEFQLSEIIELISQALAYCGYDVNPEDLLFDLTESICLIQKEGFIYFFVHRSFQEYFTAVFLSHCPSDIRDQFIEDVVLRYWDNVLGMLFDMSSDRLEATWILNKLTEYLEFVESGDPRVMAVIAQWKELKTLPVDGGFAFGRLVGGQFDRFNRVMSRFYPGRVPEMHLTVDMVDTLVQHIGKIEDFKSVDYQHRLMSRYREEDTVAYPITAAYKPALEACGMSDAEEAIYLAMKAVRSGIDDQQVVRQRFLGKVFGVARS